jgi:nicotinate-nucleotide adenylyltransferase
MTVGPDLIVFGGTFDPPHIGHLAMVKRAIDAFPGAAFLIAPNPQAPISRDAVKPPSGASFEARMEMCRLTFSRIEKTAIEISAIEQELKPPRYTVQLLMELSARHKKDRLGFLMGQDQIASFDRWHEPSEILRLADLIVVARDTTGSNQESLLAATTGALARLGIESVVRGDGLQLAGYHHRIFLLDEPVSDAQSSLLRSGFGAMKQDLRNWVTAEVAHYIAENGLYQQIG